MKKWVNVMLAMVMAVCLLAGCGGSGGTEAPEEVEKRLSCAEAELAYSNQYDYLIVNDEVEKAAEKMKAILMAERCRTNRIN